MGIFNFAKLACFRVPTRRERLMARRRSQEAGRRGTEGRQEVTRAAIGRYREKTSRGLHEAARAEHRASWLYRLPGMPHRLVEAADRDQADATILGKLGLETFPAGTTVSGVGRVKFRRMVAGMTRAW